MNNKNLKVMSSLAIAGILAATGISSVSAATPRTLGLYRKLINGTSTIVSAYEPTSSTAKLTVADLRADYGDITVSGDQVKTGTTYKKGTQTHTVVISGDIDGDGKANINDINPLIESVLGNDGKVLTGLAKEAADVKHDGKININDIDPLVSFVLNGKALNVDISKEEKVTTDVETNYEYTVAVNGNNVINSVNKEPTTDGSGNTIGGTTLTLTPKAGAKFKGNEKFTIDIFKKDEDGTYATTSAGAINDGAGTQINNTTSPATPTEFAAKYNESFMVIEHLDFSTIALTNGTQDGTYKIVVKQGTKVVAEQDIEIHANTGITADVIAKRFGPVDATISVEAYGDVNIAKVYCVVANSEPSIANLIKEENAITVTNNRLEDKVFTNSNALATPTKVWYVLEDSYGSRSAVLSLDIATAASISEAVAKIERIEDNKVNNEFKVTLSHALSTPTAEDVVGVLYRDGKAIAKKNLVKDTADANGLTYVTIFDTNVSGDSNNQNKGKIMNEAGVYTLKVYIAGTASKHPSAAKTSSATVEGEFIKFTKLIAPTSPRYVYDAEATTTKDLVVWNDNVDQEVGSYAVEVLYPVYDANLNGTGHGGYTGKYDADYSKTNSTDVARVTPGVSSDVENKYATLPSMSSNAAYKVNVTAVAKTETPQRTLNSDKSENTEIYKLDVTTVGFGTVADKQEHSVTFTSLTPIELKGSKSTNVKYKVQVYNYDLQNNEIISKVGEDINVNLTKAQAPRTGYEIKVEDNRLQAGNYYKFKLVAYTDKNQSVSGYTAAISPTNGVESLDGLIVTKTATKKEDTQGKVYYNAGTTYINGKSVNLNKYSTDYRNIFTGIIANLAEGDTITKVSGNRVTIKLKERSGENLNLSDLKGKTVELVANNSSRAITTTGSDEAEEIILTGNNNVAIFSVGTKLLAKKVSVNGVVLNDTTVAATAKGKYNLTGTNTVNNIKVTGTTELEVNNPVANSSDPQTLDVTVSNNALTFENNTENNIVVAFKGEGTLVPSQSGMVTVKSVKGGNVSVTSTNAAVTGILNVEIENGSINLTNEILSGAKVVNTTTKKGETTTVTVKLVNLEDNSLFKTKALNRAIPVKKYETDTAKAELEDLLNDVAHSGASKITLTADEFAELVDFINALGIDEDANATITTTTAGEMVLTFTGTDYATDDTTVTYKIPETLINTPAQIQQLRNAGK